MQSENEALKFTHLSLKRGFLERNCPPIEYVGAGSSRVAYALDGGVCLKIAVSKAGVAQNKNEAENMLKA